MTITADLNGGDYITDDINLTYRLYGDLDSYQTPIATFGSHVTDTNVTVTDGVVVIKNIQQGNNTAFKLSAIDEAGNESSKSSPVTFDSPTTKYPQLQNINDFDWGDWNPSTRNPIREGTTFVDDIGGESIITCIAPDDMPRCHGYYAKNSPFNADDTWMKLRGTGGQVFIPTATAGDSSTYFTTGVDGGGYWSNTDPDLIYVWIPNQMNIRIQQRGVPYSGNETIIHSFDKDIYEDFGLGMNEGNISFDDKYAAFNCRRKGNNGTDAIILDLEDCRNNPNGPNNVHSIMPIADDGYTIDWITVSPSGNYFVIAYFENFDLNPITGNAIMVYHNTAGTPTLNTDISKVNSVGETIIGCAILQESHADLGIDENGEDVWVGWKKGGVDGAADGREDVGGCVEYDNSTFLSMARLRDGRVQYLFSDHNSPKGLYGGYISCRNTQRTGYAYITEDCCQRDGAISTDLIAIPLEWNDNNMMEYYGRSYAERFWNPANPSKPNDASWSAQGCPSRDGTMIHFDSYFNNKPLYDLHPESIGQNQSCAFLLKYPQ